MKHGTTLLLKVIIVLITIGVFVGMIWFPQTEGRAASLDLFSIYKDPFIIYTYIGSIPFFVGVYQTFKLLNVIDTNKTFSQDAVKTLKNIKLASISLISFIAAGLVYIRFFANGDDPAGPTMLGLVVIFALIVITIAVTISQKSIQLVR